MRILFISLFCLGLPFVWPVAAQDSLPMGTDSGVLTAMLDVPEPVLKRVTGGTITSLYGIPVGTIDSVGNYTVQPALPGDLDILFVRGPNSDEVVLIGYEHDSMVDITVTSTALSMLLMFDPGNATLDLPGKLDLMKTYQANNDFPTFHDSVEKSLISGASPSSPSNRTMISLMSKIQKNAPRLEAPSAITSNY